MMQTMPVRTKDERVIIRVEAEDLARWRATADAEGLTLSNWIRKCCNAVAVDQELIDVVDEESRKRAARRKGGRS